MNFYICLIFILLLSPVCADELYIAVAANFTKPAKQLVRQFGTEHNINISFGSTGQFYTQIKNGAPYDIFLAADMQRPKKLVADGIASDLFVYAQGKLILWSKTVDLVNKDMLISNKFKRLAIAHPKIAPYGMAAQQVLEKLQLWDGLQDKIIRGNNISQAYQFAITGNAELGFIALSQGMQEGSYWLVPEDLYQPILQGAVLLNQTTLAKEFMNFLHSPIAQKIIVKFGYNN
ncbi:MAG: molybdate ABC transporter substrate-binding protein [Candidatus Marithrix sp.]|nr:molybdate ABC transporter substrate-binding protein [Candidatus Marithrix sp.]